MNTFVTWLKAVMEENWPFVLLLTFSGLLWVYIVLTIRDMFRMRAEITSIEKKAWAAVIEGREILTVLAAGVPEQYYADHGIPTYAQLKSRVEVLETLLAGANERAQILLASKERWMKRALEAENRR